MLAEGLNEKAVANGLEVGDRYLRRLIAAADVDPGLAPPEMAPANTPRERVQVALTRKSGRDAQALGRRPPATGFVNLAELDAWLDEGQRGPPVGLPQGLRPPWRTSPEVSVIYPAPMGSEP